MTTSTQAPEAQKTKPKGRGRPSREVAAARAPETPLEVVAVTTTETVTVERPVERKGCKCPACTHDIVPRVKKTDKLHTYMECPDCRSPFRVTRADPPMVQLL